MNKIIENATGGRRGGFTLIELMIVTIIAGIIVIGLALILVGPQRIWQRGGVLADLHREMSLANERVALALREANWITVTARGASLVFHSPDSSGRIYRDGDRMYIEVDDVNISDIRYLKTLQFIPRAGRVTMKTTFAKGRESISGELTVEMRNLSFIAHWPLNEGSGSVAFDASGWGNNAALYNTTWVHQDGNCCLLFNSSSPSYMRVPTNGGMYTGRRTVYEFRVKVTSGISQGATLFSRGDFGIIDGYNWLFIYSSRGELAFQASDGYAAHTIVSDPMTWENNRWYDITVIIDIEYGLISFWRDDECVGTSGISTSIIPVTVGEVYLGVATGFHASAYQTGWNGHIDAIYIGTD